MRNLVIHNVARWIRGMAGYRVGATCDRSDAKFGEDVLHRG